MYNLGPIISGGPWIHWVFQPLSLDTIQEGPAKVDQAQECVTGLR